MMEPLDSVPMPKPTHPAAVAEADDAFYKKALGDVMQQAEEMGVEFPDDIYQKAQNYLNQ